MISLAELSLSLTLVMKVQHIDIYQKRHIAGQGGEWTNRKGLCWCLLWLLTSWCNVESTGGILGNRHLMGMLGVNVCYGRVLFKRKMWDISGVLKTSSHVFNTFILVKGWSSLSNLTARWEDYFNVPYDDRLPVGIQEVVVFGISSNHFWNTSLHLRETGEHRLYKQKPDNQLRR